MENVLETLATAFQYHQAGYLPQAAQLYQEILRQQPNQIDALQLLGMIAAQGGNDNLAIECFSKAVEEQPFNPDFHYNLANALRQGQPEEAVTHYKLALAFNPDYAAAHNNLGLALEKQGNLEAALINYQQAIALQPNLADAHNNLGLAFKNQGKLETAIFYHQQAVFFQPSAKFHHNLANALQEQNRLEEAITHYQQAIALDPNAKFHNSLANALQEQNRLEEAITHYQQAIALEPNCAEFYNNLASALKKQNHFAEAVNCYQQALTLQPSAEIYNNLGTVLQAQMRLQEATTHYQQALTLRPNFLEAHTNLGNALVEQEQMHSAIEHYQQALSLNSNHPEVHYNLSEALLLAGDFRRGFAEYEWRWQKKDTPPRSFSQPLWDGSSLVGKTILLHGEQGFGDQIQFIRYVPLVAQYKGRIVVECSSELVRLFATIPEIVQIVARGETLPTFDVHAPLMSLPLILGTTQETLPALAYLRSTAAMPFSLDPIRLKVGIVWSGNPLYEGNRKRSCGLSYFLQLLNVPNTAFYSLQKGPQVEELKASGQVSISDLSAQLIDFADTASVVEQLDLVISTDTALAHLAGALGKQVWLLLAFAPDWRWMTEREDSPWYPTMRLFRQTQPGDWAGVFERVEQALYNSLVE